MIPITNPEAGERNTKENIAGITLQKIQFKLNFFFFS